MDLTAALAATTTSTTYLQGSEADACSRNDSSLCHTAFDLTHNADIAQSVDWASVIITILAILAVAWLIHRVVRRFIKRTIAGLQGETAQRGLSMIRRRTPKAFLNTGEYVTIRRAQRADTIGALLRSASTTAIFVIAILVILKQFSFDLGPFVPTAAVATAALAFGAQNIVRDFLAGLFIVVEDQYGVGDVIDVGSASGMVESVSLRITRLRASDGTLWHVPNGEIKKVGNKSQKWSRALLDFRVTLDTDIALAIKTMKTVADDMWRDSAYAGIIIDEPEVWAPEAIDAEGILLKLAVKTRPLEQWQISRTLRSRVKTAFDRDGITIASAMASTPSDPIAPQS